MEIITIGAYRVRSVFCPAGVVGTFFVNLNE